MRHSPRRLLVSLALAGLSVAPVCALPALSATAALPESTPGARAGVGGQLWSWMTNIWPESGCLIDPSGGKCLSFAARASETAHYRRPRSVAPAPRRLPGTARVRPTVGCGIDPGGQCH
jgi:hypothetical protein